MTKSTILTDNIATKWYRAPEILMNCNNYGKAVDVWGLGCILAEMVTGKPLFVGSTVLGQL